MTAQKKTAPKTTAIAKRDGTPEPDRLALLASVGEWYYVAKQQLDALYLSASAMRDELRRPGSPLGGNDPPRACRGRRAGRPPVGDRPQHPARGVGEPER